MIEDSITKNLRYDPGTGKITWKIPGRKRRIGEQAGTWSNGYIRIHFNRKLYAAHRIAWYLHYGRWPTGEIDHINRNRKDNRIENLRELTRAQNSLNDGKTVRGVSFEKRRQKWRVRAHRHTQWLGYFDTYEAACKASEMYWKGKLP
jgi:hypothetical protein